MTAIDYIVLFAYILLTILLGLKFARGQRTRSDFFLAGKSMRWFPIGISVMVTVFSAINYTAFPGEVFGHGLYVLLCLPVFVFVALPVTRIIMPFFHAMNLSSAYEYLERRFDGRVRRLASGIFIFWRILWGATILYVPCKVLHSITGIPLVVLILLVGITASVYTTLGGMKAVIWTDVLQFFVLIGGLTVGIAFYFQMQGTTIADIFATAGNSSLLKPFVPFDPKIFSLNPRIRITLWSCWIGTFVAFLTRYGVDQVTLQRYFSARSLREARRGFRLNLTAVIFALTLLAFLGLILYHFSIHSQLPVTGAQPIYYFAQYIRALPPGLTGILIAGLFAASMSSFDSGINSCCTAFTVDFLDRRGSLHAESLLRLRIIALAIGALMTLLALYIGRLGSIFEIANRIINAIGSPLLAIFLLAMFSRRISSRAVFLGGIAGILWSSVISLFVHNLALHYYAVVNLLGTVIFCYFFQLAALQKGKEPSQSQLQWTYYEYRKRGKQDE